GKVIASAKEILKAEEKGLPNLVASLAFQHSTTYGVLATVIAIIAGLIMGIIFKGGKGGH
ncbi:MAG: TIGR02186 family protein, partial [Deltaproteobacteria bacterium]|nr:TIGR02186 family protein [Deltaproteobacteria bacterium]